MYRYYPQHLEKNRRIRLKKPHERECGTLFVSIITIGIAESVAESVAAAAEESAVLGSFISICSADKSVSSVSADWSLLKSITADIRFLITLFSRSVCKYFFISSVAEWLSIIYSTSSSTLFADIFSIHDEDERSISIARIIYEKNVCSVIFLE